MKWTAEEKEKEGDGGENIFERESKGGAGDTGGKRTGGGSSCRMCELGALGEDGRECFAVIVGRWRCAPVPQAISG